MRILNLDQTIAAWPSIAEKVFVSYTEQEYNRLVELLDSLVDQVGDNETHPLSSMMDVIGVLIENYEAEHILELEEVAWFPKTLKLLSDRATNDPDEQLREWAQEPLKMQNVKLEGEDR